MTNNNMSTTTSSSTSEEEEESAAVLNSASRFVAVKASEWGEDLRLLLLDEVLPVIWGEFTTWRNGIWKELESYESKGNSKAGLFWTILLVFVIAFHLELTRIWIAFTRRGGLMDQWKYEWTLYYQSKQRQRRRTLKLKQKHTKESTNQGMTGAGKPSIQFTSTAAKNLASPTSTASTVEAESSMGRSGVSPLPGEAMPGKSGHRAGVMLMMKNNVNHRSLSPRPSPDRPRVLRDAYGIKIPPNTSTRNNNGWQASYDSQSMRMSTPSTLKSSHSSRSHRSASMDMSANSSSFRSNHSYRLNANGTPITNGSSTNSSKLLLGHSSNFTDSEQSFDFPPPPSTPPKSLLHSSSTNQHSESTLASSKDTRSTHNTTGNNSRTPSDRSYATPNSELSPKMVRKQLRRNTSPPRRKDPPLIPESAPVRRSATLDSPANNSNSTNTTNASHKRRIKKKTSNTSGAPLAQARRRMSGGGLTAERAAAAAGCTPPGIRRTGTNEAFARQMHPRSRSGNGAMTTTASQMYMARQPSQVTRSNSNDGSSRHHHHLHPRSKSGTGASPYHHSPRHLHPRSKSGHGASGSNHYQPRRTTSDGHNGNSANRTLSPVRTPPSTTYRAAPGQGPGPRMTRELSRQELGYE